VRSGARGLTHCRSDNLHYMRRRNASRRGTRTRTCAAAIAALATSAVTVTAALTTMTDDAAAASSSAYTVTNLPLTGMSQMVIDSATHRIYVASLQDRSITVIDGLSRTVVTTILLGDLPRELLIDPTTNTLLVVADVPQSGPQTSWPSVLLTIDTSTNTITKTTTPEAPLSFGLVDTVTHEIYSSGAILDEAGGVVAPQWDGTVPFWALNGAVDSSAGRVYVLFLQTSVPALRVTSAQTHALVASFNLTADRPDAIRVDAETHTLYLRAGHGSVLEALDGMTGAVIGRVQLGFTVSSFAIDPSAHVIYAWSIDGMTSVIDEKTDQVVATFQTAGHAIAAVDTSTGSLWLVAGLNGDVTVVDPVVSRRAGTDRITTATAVSNAAYDETGADAVVLARADTYPDALVGAPLAAKMNAPLLYTVGTTLPAATQTELQRVLAPGKTVYVLGGTDAIPDSIASQLAALGYRVVRVSGQDRYATAVAVADLLGDPTTVFLATSANFADALAAGPASTKVNGAILLTDGSDMSAATGGYLAAHPGTAYAIGGAAAAADPAATAIVGADRYATGAMVAQQFFASPSIVGVASGTTFADALPAAAMLGHAGGPLLLTDPGRLSAKPAAYLHAVGSGVTKALLFGGTAAISAAVQAQLTTALGH